MREKLIELLNEVHRTHLGKEYRERLGTIADHLIQNGVTFDDRVKELEAELEEREKVVIQLRKQWLDAEILICTMCGHFDHKTDGNIVYGNMNCGEIVGYPCCKKFTPWIPVTERLPELHEDKIEDCDGSIYIFLVSEPVVAYTEDGETVIVQYEDDRNGKVAWVEEGGSEDIVTHWMPLPEPPKEVE